MIFDAPPPQDEAPSSARDDIFVDVGFARSDQDGAAVYYEARRNPGMPVLIFNDGIGCDGYVWKYLWRALQSDYQLVHWHYRGHGRTPIPSDRRGVTLDLLVTDMLSVLDHLEIDKACFVGHSLGVQVALEAYRRAADKCQALLLLCGAAATPLRTFRGTDMLESLLPLIQSAARLAPRFLESIAKTLLPSQLSFELAKRFELNGALIRQSDFMPYLRALARVPPDLFMNLLASAAHHSANDILSEITVPTLVVAGEKDSFTPMSLSHTMVAAIPKAELLMVPEGSHSTPLECPELVNRAVRDFLAERVATKHIAAARRP